MPKTLEEWKWWVFSVVLVGMAINLLSPVIARRLTRWSHQQNLKQLTHNQIKQDFVEKMASLAAENQSVLAVVLYRAADNRARGYLLQIIGFLAVFAAGMLALHSEGSLSSGIFMGIIITMGVLLLAMGEQSLKQGRLYRFVIDRYETILKLSAPPE